MDELRSSDPRWIGHYRLEGQLGGGGMGRVYLGRSPGGRHVAIKVIRTELAQDAEFRARFAREVAAARKVSGIFTAAVVDADPDAPLPWLATSYVAGPSLARAVADRGPLPADVVLTLAAGLAEGLDAIHSAGVVHRDLTPSNVLLAEDGPRLIDFGISRSAEGSTLTRTGMVVGSPGFMSPEQAQGRQAGPPSDIFSLGAVLAFAATGEGPFGAGPSDALLDRVVRDEPRTRGLPAEIRPMIERCLAKDPLRRPTAAQLLAELATAAPVAVFQPGRTLAPAPTVTMPAPYLATTPDMHPAGMRAGQGAARGRPGPGRRRAFRRGWRLAAAAAVVLAAAGAGAFLTWRMSGHTPLQAGPATSAASSARATQSSGAAVMAALGGYLARSASVRPTVQPAIDGVRACSQSPPAGRAALQQAIDTRQDILNHLQVLSPSGLPGGIQLIGELKAAMRYSIDADRHYQDWMADFARTGTACGTDPGQNPSYLAGQNASALAATAKRTFAGLWNPVAPRYGQKAYVAADF